ncbi:hypothetical protein GCM10011392_27820 [Wenxinia marina]|nr:hypothetical protein GCM10011392_27820 [Wenxinia marina]
MSLDVFVSGSVAGDGVITELVAGLALWCGPSRSVALRCRHIDYDIIADWRERFQRQVAAALDGPFFGLLHQDRSDEPAD